MTLRIPPEPQVLWEVPLEFSGPQEGDKIIQKSHCIRNAFRTCGEVEPRDELGGGEGMVVSVLRKNKASAVADRSGTSRMTLLAVYARLTSSPDRVGERGALPGPGCQKSVCHLQHTAFKVPLGYPLPAEARGREDRVSCRRLLCSQPGSGVHMSLPPLLPRPQSHSHTEWGRRLGDAGQRVQGRGALHRTWLLP